MKPRGKARGSRVGREVRAAATACGTAMSKVRRTVTVESSKTVSENALRRPSVFERLGPGGGGGGGGGGGAGTGGGTASTTVTPVQSKTTEICRNWMKGRCNYGNSCRFSHPLPRSKNYRGSNRRSPDRVTTDLRERMKNKRQDLEAEPTSRRQEASPSPGRRDSTKVKRRSKEEANIKIIKARTPPESDGEPPAWDHAREGKKGCSLTDSDNGDAAYDFGQALSLELQRQKLQLELIKLEQERELEEREELVIQKQVSPEPAVSKRSPSPKRKCKSPKRRILSPCSPSAPQPPNKKNKKGPRTPSPPGDAERKYPKLLGKKKGPRTPSPSPLPPSNEARLLKKHKDKLKEAEGKNKERKEMRDGKAARGDAKEPKHKGKDVERGRDKDRKDRVRDKGRHHSDSSTTSPQHSPSPPANRASRRSPSPVHRKSGLTRAVKPLGRNREQQQQREMSSRSPERGKERRRPSPDTGKERTRRRSLSSESSRDRRSHSPLAPSKDRGRRRSLTPGAGKNRAKQRRLSASGRERGGRASPSPGKERAQDWSPGTGRKRRSLSSGKRAPRRQSHSPPAVAERASRWSQSPAADA
ncbi:zinc finger CCCH domain-containing protein 13-like isoform X1 [Lethenteron reissneri]|uniref:zinc finger CCCH domain-containing protein 13-like isoform X1 n=2 Tax=Lethenteron reissneri TaxID=7753 RepID=UPI002AB73C19|nr:zinc finger CCCH domain-containing protein 13-like isoform X1 [Lethenteron reissneri]